MHRFIKWLLVLLVVSGLAFFFLRPNPHVSFEALYAKVDPATVHSLQSFRNDHPPRPFHHDSVDWEYIVAGQGADTIVFLHGMTGAYDIWWQQIDMLKTHYRIISVTYPPVRSLSALEKGVLAILDHEGVDTFNAVGTSLGGYFVQYLMGQHPHRLQSVVLSNTFPPNDLIAEKNKVSGALLPRLPESLVMYVFRGNFRKAIYPTSGHDELTLAFLNEIGRGRMRKAQVVGRYHCVIEKFSVTKPSIPMMIIESDNDPLVEDSLRARLKATYPNTVIYTYPGAGHFPYLNYGREYSHLLLDFFSKSKQDR